MGKYFIDLLSIAFEIYVAMVFFGIFWNKRSFKRYQYCVGISIAAILNTMATALLQNNTMLPIVSTIILFSLSFYFISGITSKLLFSALGSAIFFATEQLIAFLATQALTIPIEQVQNVTIIYLTGVLASKLLALTIVFIIKALMNSIKHEADKQFNLLLAVMPIQSIILCFIVYGYTSNIDALQTPLIEIVALIISIGLVFITIVILNNQRKAMLYKKENEIAQLRLATQIEHYQKLYQSQQEVKSIRHDLSNKLLAITGLLKDGRTQDAINHVSGIQSEVERTSEIVDTGLPPVDAVLTAKITAAAEFGINIEYKILIDDCLNIDQFDLAIVVANALDNGIEGILRSDNVRKHILLRIASAADYISILVTNFSSGPVYEDFRTSKTDKYDHGFGIPQMRAIAQKYEGDIQPSYDRETGEFSLKLLLKNRSE